MLAQLRTGYDPGKPTYLTAEEFEERYTLTRGGQRLCLQTEAIWWAYNGRLGSRCSIADELYVKVRDENDDPFQYYTPEKPINYAPMPMKSCCDSGGCSDGGGSCSGGSCGGSCP